MGQRLNVQIEEKGKVLANAYYHWSGYTSSSIRIVYEALSYLRNDSSANGLATAVQALIKTGAGLSEKEHEALSKMDTGGRIFIKTPQVDRNEGLIAVTEQAIKETQYWEEARAVIDIAEKTVNLEGIFWQWELESWKADYEETEDPEARKVQLSDIKWEDFNKAVDEINKNHQWLDTESGMVIGHIE